MTIETQNENKNKITVLQVLPSLESGGVERGTVEMVKAMVKAGIRPIVASAGGVLVKQITSAGGEHIKLPLNEKNPIKIWANSKKLEKIIKESGVDIVHARSRAPAWSAYMACKNTGCKFVTTFHGAYSSGSKLKKLYNSVMIRSNKVIAVSEFIKNHILDTYQQAEADKITVVHRGVDINQFDIDKLQKNRIIELDRKLQIDHNKPVIMMPGRITRWKGHEFLLDALSTIAKEKYFCIFVGDDKNHAAYKKRLIEKIKRFGLTNNVRFISHVADMPAMYSMADIVVSSSIRPEAFGRVAIEAQAMERLVIATKHGGSEETIVNEKTGWLVEPGNVMELKATIENALDLTPQKRKSITAEAKKHIFENFSTDKMTGDTIKIYKEILNIKDIEKVVSSKKATSSKKPSKPVKKTAKTATKKVVKGAVAKKPVKTTVKKNSKPKPKVTKKVSTKSSKNSKKVLETV